MRWYLWAISEVAFVASSILGCAVFLFLRAMKLNLDNPLIAETKSEDLDILQTYANEIDLWNGMLVPGLTGIALSLQLEQDLMS